MPSISPKVTPYYGGGQASNPANVVQIDNVPSVKLTDGNLGTIAVDNAHNRAYMLTSKSGGVSSWTTIGTLSGGGVAVLSGDTGIATPNLGDITISGVANQTVTSTSAHSVEVGLANDVIIPSSLTVSSFLQVDSSIHADSNIVSDATILGDTVEAYNDIVSSLGNLFLVNGKIRILTGADKSVGADHLIGGTVLVHTNKVSSHSQIFLTNAGPSGTPGILSVGTMTAGVSFVINSTSPSDTSLVNWWIIN